jgi:quinoprotein glucose dehydrogenase
MREIRLCCQCLFSSALFFTGSPWSAASAARPEPGQIVSSPAPSASTNSGARLASQNLRLAPDLRISVFATDTLVANPIRLAVDERSRVFIVESHRTGSVLDLRQHLNWLEANLSFRSVTDRSNFVQKVLVPENTASWPEILRRDRNGDGKFDASDLAADSERIRVLEDRDEDGAADFAGTFADGFASSVTGVAGGFLVRGTNAWFACAPDLWLLRDANHDGKSDLRRSLHSGFGVHLGSGESEFSGLCYGPDGLIYFAVGDNGFNVATGNQRFALPDTGAVLRCNPDGTEFEVIATGLRRPTDLAFDPFGNLWTVDAASDENEPARLLCVLEGADCGWHIGWRDAGDSSPWKTERLGELFPANTASCVLPPTALVGRRPAGFAFYPGTGLPPRYDNRLFLCDLDAGVASFALKATGASHEIFDFQEFLGGVSPLDLDFGPEGGLYLVDAKTNSERPDRSRILRVFDPNAPKDPVISETKRLLSEGMSRRSNRDVVRLLEHRDWRVRLEAQFALADRGAEVTNQLFRVASKNPNLFARLHALWALGQIARVNPEVSFGLALLTGDADPEVRAQVAHVLGNARFGEALEPLARLVQDTSPRVRLFAAFALGKLGRQEATDPILLLLRQNGDRDPHLQHAGVMALVWLNDMNALLAAAKDSSAAVRMGVLLAMRRLGRPEIATFLYDSNPALILEAARAIYDLPLASAFTQLAVLAGQPSRLAINENGGSVALRTSVLRRSLNANFRLGKLENALALAEFAGRKELPEALRAEALERLAQWAKPVLRDPLLGLWRPIPPREIRPASLAARREVAAILKDAPGSVQIAAIHAAEALEITSVTSALFEMAANPKLAVELRRSALSGLGSLKDTRLAEAIAIAVVEPAEPLRQEAVRWLAHLKPSDAIGQIAATMERGSLVEKQTALRALADVATPATDQILSVWLDLLAEGRVPRELQLDLLEAAKQRPGASLQSKLQKFETSRPASDPLATYREVLYGGDAPAGQRVFFSRAELDCARCHRINGQGGEHGPDLSKIGASASREALLESLLAPDKTIVRGYETVVVKMKSGKTYKGRVKNETERELLLTSPDEGFLVLSKSQIESREKGPTLMPADAAKLLTRRELRDLIEYLANLK